ncbi:MAG TPA: DUF4198 domain-containing protein [Azonexus sp.]|nr:DUF4198 domain-containing protein [Azonexus sp.]
MALSLTAWPALAHDLWLEGDGTGYTLLQGHRHSGHAGAETLPYDAAGVRGALCLGDDGKIRPTTFGKTHPVRINGNCAALQLRYSSGYWTKTAWETRNLPKTGITGVIRSWRSEESVKRIDRWHLALTQPMGNDLELVPQSNPFTVKTGDKLIITVSDAGKPVANVPVAYAGETRGVTDDKGRIAIRLRQAGMQLITASIEAPLNDGKADISIRSASLQFEVAP